MCTVVSDFDPGAAWPVLLAANRDEMLDRPWDAPGAHWPDRPGVVAGRDRLGGGTWMGVNRNGVVATVLNRIGTLGPAPGKRSRGELPLLALEAETAEAAAARIAALNAGDYRTFNMVIADRAWVIVLRGLGEGRPERLVLAPGLHMTTAHDPDDMTSARVARHLPRLRAAVRPILPDWGEWAGIIADRTGPPPAQINVGPRAGFGTTCSSLLAIGPKGQVYWEFAPGPPDRVAFGAVTLC